MECSDVTWLYNVLRNPQNEVAIALLVAGYDGNIYSSTTNTKLITS